MPISIACPACGARLKAPDGAAGRRFRCPRCQAAFLLPAESGPPPDLAFDSPRLAADDANPFADDGPGDEPEATEAPTPRKGRRPTAKKAKPGFNPFEEGADAAEPAPAQPPAKRKYRKDGDYNPFGDAPADEVPDPAGDGFEFGIEAPPPAPAGEFDFGPPDPRGDDDGPRRRRR